MRGRLVSDNGSSNNRALLANSTKISLAIGIALDLPRVMTATSSVNNIRIYSRFISPLALIYVYVGRMDGEGG